MHNVSAGCWNERILVPPGRTCEPMNCMCAVNCAQHCCNRCCNRCAQSLYQPAPDSTHHHFMRLSPGRQTYTLHMPKGKCQLSVWYDRMSACYCCCCCCCRMGAQLLSQAQLLSESGLAQVTGAGINIWWTDRDVTPFPENATGRPCTAA